MKPQKKTEKKKMIVLTPENFQVIASFLLKTNFNFAKAKEVSMVYDALESAKQIEIT